MKPDKTPLLVCCMASWLRPIKNLSSYLCLLDFLLFTLAIGSSSSFRFPEIQDMCIVPIDAILILADPRALSDCIYTVKERSYSYF